MRLQACWEGLFISGVFAGYFFLTAQLLSRKANGRDLKIFFSGLEFIISDLIAFILRI